MWDQLDYYGSITHSLLQGEQIICNQAGVGLYDGSVGNSTNQLGPVRLMADYA